MDEQVDAGRDAAQLEVLAVEVGRGRGRCSPTDVPCSTASASGSKAAQLPRKCGPLKAVTASRGEAVVVGEAEAALAVADEQPSVGVAKLVALEVEQVPVRVR